MNFLVLAWTSSRLTQNEMMNLWQAMAETNLLSFLLEILTWYKHQQVSKSEVSPRNFTKQCALRQFSTHVSLSRHRISKDQLFN